MPTESLYITEQQGAGFSLGKRLVLFSANKDVSLFRLTNTWRRSPKFSCLTLCHNNNLSHTSGQVRSLNLTNPFKIPSESNEPTSRVAANNYTTSALCFVQKHNNTPLGYQLVYMAKQTRGKLMLKRTYTQWHCRSQHWCPDRETRHDHATNVNGLPVRIPHFPQPTFLGVQLSTTDLSYSRAQYFNFHSPWGAPG